MTDVPLPQTPTDRAGLNATENRRATAIARLAIGLAQGIALWWLFQSKSGETWPATQPALFWPLVLTLAYLPIVLLAGVGRMRWRTLVLWGAVAGTALMLLAWHDIARQSVGTRDPILTFPLAAFSAAALFIGHHLILPADRARSWIGPYPSYFDVAWMAGVQLVLSIGFTGALWLLLFLGAALFGIIGLSFLSTLIGESWFSIPVTTLTFAFAVQLTDVRDGLIRGIRSVALMLLSWLLPVLTVLVSGFLAALVFTGLDDLWDTGSATALVLSAAGGLIILINTAYQDGRTDNLPPSLLRGAVRVASVLLTPLVLIAFWGLWLRIGQHGLTPDRIIALACSVVGAAYAIGYGAAALLPLVRKVPWMRTLEPTNIAAAVLEVAIILLLFSPVLDPARLSVADQMSRLERGAVTPQDFDYAFLRFDGGRAGEAALADLARSSTPEIARGARTHQQAAGRHDDDLRPSMPAPEIQSWPVGTTLPPAFVSTLADRKMERLCSGSGGCVATQRDLNGDGRPEILLAGPFQVTLFEMGGEGRWIEQGAYRVLRCSGEGAAERDPRLLLKSGDLMPRPAEWPDLLTGGRVPSGLNPTLGCRDQSSAVNP